MGDYERRNEDFATGLFEPRRNINRKITYEQREQIKRLYSEGATARELAEQFPVTAGYIYQICESRPRKRP